MTPEASPPPAIDSQEGPSFRAAFRRGRILVMVMVTFTLAYQIVLTLHDFSTGEAPAKLSDLLGSWALAGFLCWCVSRGGWLSSGCLILMCAPLCVGLLFGMVGVVLNCIPYVHFTGGVNGFPHIGEHWQSTLLFLPVGAWATYTLWVLLISRDARVYLDARRREVAEAEARNFEWPPTGR